MVQRRAAPGHPAGRPGLGPQGAAELTSGEEFDGGPVAPVGPVEGYLYEPDGAVIRAGLVADVALQLGGHLVDEHIAYICAPELQDTPFARAYRVLEVMPFNVKALKAWVRENGIGVLDIKKRGTSVTPEELRKQLLPGGQGRQGAGRARARKDSHPGPHQDRRGQGGRLRGARVATGPALPTGRARTPRRPGPARRSAGCRCTARTAPAPGWWRPRRR